MSLHRLDPSREERECPECKGAERWKAQGFQVQRGEKAIRLPLIYQRTEKDPETGEERSTRRMGRSAVFCRCQVRPIEGGAR